MKKNILIIITLLFISLPVSAKTLKAVSLCRFSTDNPDDYFAARIIETQKLSKDKYVKVGTEIYGRVVNINHPQVGKRDASFDFIIDKVTYNDKVRVLENPDIVASVVPYDPSKTQNFVFRAAKTGAGFFVKGLTQGISFVQGVASADKGTRLKSGVNKVYQDSPLSYVEKGIELHLIKGEPVLLKLDKI